MDCGATMFVSELFRNTVLDMCQRLHPLPLSVDLISRRRGVGVCPEILFVQS
jgi:hypothetical protein